MTEETIEYFNFRAIPNPSSALLSKAVVGGVGLELPPEISAPPGMAMVLLFVPMEEVTTRSMPELQEDLGLPWSDQNGNPVWFDELAS
jgi:hypothetical protein